MLSSLYGMHEIRRSFLVLAAVLVRLRVAAPLLTQRSVDVTIGYNISTLSCVRVPNFWSSTGLCPPDPHNDSISYFNSSDMRQNMRLISALPFKSVQQIRLHWLLDLVVVKSTNELGHVVYDCDRLDVVVHLVYQRGLHLGFELMGNPSNYFSNFENSTQVFSWYYLVRQVVERYILKYGISYVKRWNFETWNEPGQTYFLGLNMTVQGFLNYYDACAKGLKDANSHLELGGPAMFCNYDSPAGFCSAFLRHITNGSDFFSKLPSTKPQFISFHIKGGSEDFGNATYLLQEELAAVQQLHQNFPKLDDVPLYNDEADPVAGWNKTLNFRATAEYAAFAARIIIAHMTTCEFLRSYKLLSNDNAFLSYFPYEFTQRTLLARFQINNTSPKYTVFVKKPIYGLMGLLPLLGDQVLQLTGLSDSTSAELSAVATVSESWGKQWSLLRFAVILQRSHVQTSRGSLSENASDQIVSVRLHFGIPYAGNQCRCAVYKIDSSHGNPYRAWQKLGRPKFPQREKLRRLWDSEPPSRTVGPHIFSFDAALVIRLRLPSVALVHICCGSRRHIGRPSLLTFEHVSHFLVLIAWSDESVAEKCLLTYEVEVAATEVGNFTKINNRDSAFPSYYHMRRSGTAGYYRVRAVDYWYIPGSYSDATYYANAKE